MTARALRLGRSWLRVNAGVLALVLGSRLWIFAVCALAHGVVSHGRFYGEGWRTGLGLFDRWDSGWYGTIVRDGYHFSPGQYSNVVFFPLYPLLVRAFMRSGLDMLAAAFVVSNLAFTAAALYLRGLCRFDLSEEAANRAVAFAVFFPTSFFFSAFYTEGLFLLTVTGCLFYARRRSWWLAGLFGALGALTRSNGIWLVVPVAWEYVVAHGREGRPLLSWRALSIGLIPAGLAVYMAYLGFRFGAPFAFMHAAETWGRHPTWFWTSLIQTWHWPIEPFYRWTFCAVPIFALAVTLVMPFRRLPSSYVAFMIVSLVYFTSTSNLEAIGRYVSVLSPMYVALGAITERRTVTFALFIALFAMFLSLHVVLFVTGHWMT